MELPSMRTLAVVMDPTSRDSGGVTVLDAVLDLWRQRRAARHSRSAFAKASDRKSVAGPERRSLAPIAGLAMLSPSAWTGDIARPGR